MLRPSQIVLILVASAAGVAVCNAQKPPVANFPTSIALRLTVTIDGDVDRAANVTVELMDAVGSSSVMDRKLTDSDGRVNFQAIAGMHRIRITGSNIQPYEGELELTRNETSHLERIRVLGARSQRQASEQPPRGIVAAVRLNVPASARKAYEKGSEAMHQQQWPESRALFETAIRDYPQFDLAYNSLGVVQIQMNDVEAARQSFSKAAEINPDFADAYRNLARILLAERKYQEADMLLVKSLSTDSLNVWALATAANLELIAFRVATEVVMVVEQQDAGAR